MTPEKVEASGDGEAAPDASRPFGEDDDFPAGDRVQSRQVQRLLEYLGPKPVQFISLVPAGTGNGPMRVELFKAGDAAADAFVARSDREGRACYYSLNIVRDGLAKKATKADITSARGVHVDIDPVEGQQFDQAGKLAMLAELPIPPSFIVNSGNGLQPIWLFAQPVLRLEAVEGINRRLIELTGGDSCFNIDRLLRVPGSLNTPTAKKAAVGRVPVPSSFVA